MKSSALILLAKPTRTQSYGDSVQTLTPEEEMEEWLSGARDESVALKVWWRFASGEKKRRCGREHLRWRAWYDQFTGWKLSTSLAICLQSS